MRKNTVYRAIIFFIFVIPIVTVLLFDYNDKKHNIEHVDEIDNITEHVNEIEHNIIENDVTIEVEELGRVSFCAGGDIIPHIPLTKSALKSDGTYDFTKIFKYVSHIIDSADIAYANLETPISERGLPSGFPRFNAPKKLLEDLKTVGFNVLGTANNHAIDRSVSGFNNTISYINEFGIIQVGGKTNDKEKNYRIFEKNGVKIGLTAYTYAYNGLDVSLPEGHALLSRLDKKQIEHDYKEMMMEAPDFTVIFPHWGVEYRSVENEEQREYVNYFADIGYDLVLGSHPHVIQSYEILSTNSKQVPVVYSLGNLLSNQRREHLGSREVENGLIFKCDFVKTSEKNYIENIEFYPLWLWKTKESGKYKFYLIPVNEFLTGDLSIAVSKQDREKILGAKHSIYKALGINDNQQ